MCGECGGPGHSRETWSSHICLDYCSHKLGQSGPSQRNPLLPLSTWDGDGLDLPSQQDHNRQPSTGFCRKWGLSNFRESWPVGGVWSTSRHMMTEVRPFYLGRAAGSWAEKGGLRAIPWGEDTTASFGNRMIFFLPTALNGLDLWVVQ